MALQTDSISGSNQVSTCLVLKTSAPWRTILGSVWTTWPDAQTRGKEPTDGSIPLTARRPLSARPPAGLSNEEGDSRSRTRWFHRSEPRRACRSEALAPLHLHGSSPQGVPRGKPPGRTFTRPQAGAYEANRRSRRLLGRVWVLFLRGKSIPPVGAGTHKSNLKGNSNFPRPEGAEDSPRPEGAEDPPPPEGRPKKEVTL